MRFKSDSQRRAMFANLNRFAAAPETFMLYVYRGQKHRGPELVGSAEQVMNKAKDLTVERGVDEIVVTGTDDTTAFHWKAHEGVLFPKKKETKGYYEYLNDDDTSGDFVSKDNFSRCSNKYAEKSSAEKYRELDDYLKSVGMTWEEYAGGKPIPGTIYDQGVPTPEEEYHESLRRGRAGAVIGMTTDDKKDKYRWVPKTGNWVKVG